MAAAASTAPSMGHRGAAHSTSSSEAPNPPTVKLPHDMLMGLSLANRRRQQQEDILSDHPD